MNEPDNYPWHEDLSSFPEETLCRLLDGLRYELFAVPRHEHERELAASEVRAAVLVLAEGNPTGLFELSLAASVRPSSAQCLAMARDRWSARAGRARFRPSG